MASYFCSSNYERLVPVPFMSQSRLCTKSLVKSALRACQLQQQQFYCILTGHRANCSSSSIAFLLATVPTAAAAAVLLHSYWPPCKCSSSSIAFLLATVPTAAAAAAVLLHSYWPVQLQQLFYCILTGHCANCSSSSIAFLLTTVPTAAAVLLHSY
jgi:hypothetical protein